MPHPYAYNTLTNLTREELFFWIAVDQTLEQLGGVDAAAAIAILSGQPYLPTRGKFGGATKGTSVASVLSRRLIKQKLPFAVPTLTGASISTLKITFTRSLGAFIGRLVPGVGWAVLAHDVVLILRNTVLQYNLRVIRDDKLW